LASERAACFERGEQGGTFNGNPLMTAAGLAVVGVASAPAFLENVRLRGGELRAELRSLEPHGIVEVRGRGLLVAARLESARAEAVRDAAFSLGLLVNAPRPDTLRFMPALNVVAEDITAMKELLTRALRTA
jgi:acetylornithine/N-succinyldiaminopimelate aminotransferase